MGFKAAVHTSIVGTHDLFGDFQFCPRSHAKARQAVHHSLIHQTVYDRGGGVGRGLGVGRVLGVGVGLGVGEGLGGAVVVGVGVAVAVGVGVAGAVGVAVAVAVDVGVGVGVGVPPPPGARTPTVMGDPVLKKPTVALALCGG